MTLSKFYASSRFNRTEVLWRHRIPFERGAGITYTCGSYWKRLSSAVSSVTEFLGIARWMVATAWLLFFRTTLWFSRLPGRKGCLLIATNSFGRNIVLIDGYCVDCNCWGWPSVCLSWYIRLPRLSWAKVFAWLRRLLTAFVRGKRRLVHDSVMVCIFSIVNVDC